MRVFISWSGPRSRAVAELLKNWIKGVIQATDPFISTDEVHKGTIWFSEIGDALASTNLGILCLTTENVSNPWILFEAGALSKGLPKSRVWTLLIDLEVTDLKPPLSQFNATRLNKDEMAKLVNSINVSLGEKALPESVLNDAFSHWWPGLEQKVKEALASTANTSPTAKRDAYDLAVETLTLVRAISMRDEGPRKLAWLSHHVAEPLPLAKFDKIDELAATINATKKHNIFGAVSVTFDGLRPASDALVAALEIFNVSTQRVILVGPSTVLVAGDAKAEAVENAFKVAFPELKCSATRIEGVLILGG